VRITAGVGTVNQKTWNIRRPVTLIGSGPNCQIVLPGAAVAKAHCAIINNGVHVLLKDLCTPSGTCCGGRPVDLHDLRDGDVVEIGDFRIQVAIQCINSHADQTASGIRFDEAGSLPSVGIWLHPAGNEPPAHLQSPVCLIGRREECDLAVADPQVSLAHAILFWFDGRAVVADLGSRTGTWINGQRQALAFLEAGDLVRVGSYEATIQTGESNSNTAPERPDTMAQLEATLRAQEASLAEREAACERKLLYLNEMEKALNRRQEQLNDLARRLRAATAPANTCQPFAQVVPLKEVITPDQEPVESSSAMDAIDRAWRLIRRGNA
jgi:pSer/pThr/pTyr-binding forkhead associated (FHA) protein